MQIGKGEDIYSLLTVINLHHAAVFDVAICPKSMRVDGWEIMSGA